MPRKSKELRLQQTQDLIGMYKAAGVDGTSLKFMQDMNVQMGRGKYPSKRQRDWLDRLIEEGVPVPEEPTEAYAKMQAAREAFLAENKHWEAKVLGDFAHREAKGWGFSEKQQALLARLLDQAETVKAGKHKLILNDTQRGELEIACRLWTGYSSIWRAERPALSRARSQCLEYLTGSSYIEQYHYDKVMNGVKAKFAKFKKSRFASGDMGYTGGGKYNDGTGTIRRHSKKVWICTSDAYINDRGQIVNDWIGPDGLAITKDQDQIGKR